MDEKPRPLPVRKVGDGPWEILIVGNDRWLQCDSEQHARTIAKAPVYEYEALERLRSGVSFAADLGELADVMERYRFGFGSRFFRRRAEEARQANP